MNIAALVITLIALRTVRLAAASAASGERAAKAGERAVEQALLESKNRHYQKMVILVQQLHEVKGGVGTNRHMNWMLPRNRLMVLTYGIDEDIPQTLAMLACTMPAGAPTEESQQELLDVIERNQRALYADRSAEERQNIYDGPSSNSRFTRLKSWSMRRAAGI